MYHLFRNKSELLHTEYFAKWTKEKWMKCMSPVQSYFGPCNVINFLFWFECKKTSKKLKKSIGNSVTPLTRWKLGGL